MSLTKSSQSYARHMDELFEQEQLDAVDNSDFEYEEYRYLQQRGQERKDPLESFGDFINRLVDPKEKEEKPPADDVQTGETDE